MALMKPQFEADKSEVNRGAGVIKNPDIHARVISELKKFVHDFKAWNGEAMWNRLSKARRVTWNF